MKARKMGGSCVRP